MTRTPNQWHSTVPLVEPSGWTFRVSHAQTVRRLVVFVHGFNGSAMRTWLDFPSGSQEREWYREADLLFVAYPSLKDNITGAANRLRRELPKFFPDPAPAALEVDGHSARRSAEPYDELVLVGHSLGGLVIRRALCDAAAQWDMDGGPESGQHPILRAEVRLFSPASAGFRAAGHLGIVRATGLWGAIEAVLRRSSAYTDLQPGSPTLEKTRERTEHLADKTGLCSLRARIVWANPDDVVIPERYTTDHVDDSWDDTTHSTVCKPKRQRFEKPWMFVESGATS